MEKLTPETILTWQAGLQPVIRTIAYPPGQHPARCPIVDTMTAVAMETPVSTRWYGFERAAIGPDLRMHVLVSGIQTRDEVVACWDEPEPDCRMF
jgi:hypothetical protein